MENLKLEENKITNDIRNLSNTRNSNKAIKDIILRDIKNLYEHEEESSNHKPVRVNNFWINNYIEYESNSDRNRTISVVEYLNKIRLYLKDIITNLKKSNTWKIQLTIADNSIFSIDNDEEHVMLLQNDNIGIMINEADKAIN